MLRRGRLLRGVLVDGTLFAVGAIAIGSILFTDITRVVPYPKLTLFLACVVLWAPFVIWSLRNPVLIDAVIVGDTIEYRFRRKGNAYMFAGLNHASDFDAELHTEEDAWRIRRPER